MPPESRFNKWDQQPRILTDAEIANPMQVIHEVFDYAHLPDLRNALWEWLKTTVTGNFNKNSLHFKDRESLLAFYERMEKLLEAAHMLMVAKKLTSSNLPFMKNETATYNATEPIVSPAVELKPIIDQLVYLLSPDFVFEMGKVEDIEVSSPVYHFIIALPGNATRTYADYQALVETTCTENGTVQILSAKTVELQKHLEQGHLLFSRFCKHPYLLYQKEGISLSSPAIDVLPELATNAENNFDLMQYKARAFYEGAVFYLTKGNYPLAVFMLQQAAEHMLRAFFQTITHRNCIGHDLTVLRRQALPLYPELVNLLPVNRNRNTCLLHRFGKAYVNARYDNEFTMPVTEISQLKEWAENLLIHTKPALMRHIHALLSISKGHL